MIYDDIDDSDDSEGLRELDFTDRARYGGQLPIMTEAEIDDCITVADMIAPACDPSGMELYGVSGVTYRYLQ